MAEEKWTKRIRAKSERIARAASFCNGKRIPAEKMTAFLEAVLNPGDTVILEGDNQKQASFLSAALEECDTDKVHDLHMVIPSVSRPEHLNIFENGVASLLDFSYAGSQSMRIAHMLEDQTLQIGAIHTYVELYARLFVDLIPDVCLEPAEDGKAEVQVTTSLDGNGEIWRCVLERFFEESPVCVNLEINDFGATPGVVQLRLMQVLELAEDAGDEKGAEQNEAE